ncbi:hypothetical protein Htur_1055 [Haloterrigena turkmenica DSM 5511]|uniref:Uncharacterized protein n=1 Tax=Haloterrigena turkmenica (strain ATCC 51198 / DSM 5511 / JCM 9101 / NCIMB 13204 / VKM B-1734 / 4k) TaxID=543526 RepID=D2RYP6_HALTV|nr:hypothetical protein [Haloterrigena turkmenica]ADB59947.1 hypothetical protein Htur_1055 [Haloterrigena turkmenica DSM 5511]
MSTEVTVHVNRGSTDSLEPSVDSVETRGSVNLRLASHGAPAHVHCRLDGDLERIAALETSNYYVEGDGETVVPVRVSAEAIDEPIEGAIEVQTGYGAESVVVPVTVNPVPDGVDVDESFAEPRRQDTGQSPTGLDRILSSSGLDPGTLAVCALGLFAAVIGTLTAAAIGGPVATAGVVIVVAGVAAALFLLVR